MIAAMHFNFANAPKGGSGQTRETDAPFTDD